MSCSISRSTELAMGHRLRKHPGLCKNYHGHNYDITFYIDGPVDDETGMVMDFKQLKMLMKFTLDQYDHAMCLHEHDELVPILRAAGSKLVTLDVEPTAENLAKQWLIEFKYIMNESGFDTKKFAASISVAETSDTSASPGE